MVITCNGYMPFHQYSGFTQVFIMLDVGLHRQEHPPIEGALFDYKKKQFLARYCEVMLEFLL